MEDRMNTLVAQYLEAWNTTDAQARAAAVERVFTPDATYVDPLVSVAGHEQLAAAIGGVQAQFPGWVFRPAGPIDGHHDQVRFTWELGPVDGPAVVVGFDVAIIADGRIASVYGFLDKVPSAA
ncbi:nuclear transport factor 2 family protein [Nocardia cyriacigeorgica]|uniref:Nuclear transport factor 2 family protein n=2 Tax=Nocardia cyriacigeorgica TaxID=135487 RepID=A0A6P1DB28_9NOCA|nr:nuclear transport factor 2 family protein [Nocardia cyriacigeorgica]NEW46771.1 nuclear transport factor 2 family protein [Nocardia cyriacigeorgica]NEW52042.1 nuclear transport factor 2 family protein [Nocardia cyriacigeorgica]NEW55835.1 nuclear transport factor 2 family protein [Nocardia cyriacigeorgica]